MTGTLVLAATPIGRVAIAGKTASGEPEPMPVSVTPEGAFKEQALAD